MKTINELAKEAHQIAIEKGWHDEPTTFGEQLANKHAELSEAWEDYRDGRGMTEIYYKGAKPCGIPIELADTVIRIMDTCETYGIDLEAAILHKMAFNRLRPHKHGGKVI